jgi:hypothetical protein
MAFTPLPNRLTPDSWDQDKHQSLKRWEKFAQKSAWKQRGKEREITPLPCPWRSSPSDPISFGPAHVHVFFEGGLMLVRFVGHLEATAGIRVLRGGIPWELWCPILLGAYQAGAPVPDPFRPRRRIPAPWIEQVLKATPDDQKSFFERLRLAGFLQPVFKISAEGVAPWLRWDEIRSRFLDFAE